MIQLAMEKDAKSRYWQVPPGIDGSSAYQPSSAQAVGSSEESRALLPDNQSMSGWRDHWKRHDVSSIAKVRSRRRYRSRSAL